MIHRFIARFITCKRPSNSKRLKTITDCFFSQIQRLPNALLCALVLVHTPTIHAEGEEGAVNNKPQYVHLQPAFVLNYGEPKGRLKYLRTEVALRVLGDINAEKVNRHTPYLRNQLVFLLSQQTAKIINNSQGREELRKKALEEVRAAMVFLEEAPLVEDLYFQNFVVQN